MKIINKFFGNVIVIFSMIVLFCSFVANILYTSFIRTSIVNDEFILITPDNIIGQVCFLIIILISLFLLNRYSILEKINIIYLKITLILFVLVVGVIWISMTKVYPLSDSNSLLLGVLNFDANSYSMLLPGEYFDMYPFQLGIASYLRFISFFIGHNRYFILRLINLFQLIGSYIFILKITDFLFSDKKVIILTTVLLFGFSPAIMYCTFIYGVIPGLFFVIIDIYFLLMFLKSHKSRHLILAIIFMSIAYLIKPNYLIFFIAQIVIMFMNFLVKKDKLIVISIILFSILTFVPAKINLAYYQNKVDHNLTGVPQLAWLAMGIQESGRAPGWYNGYTFDVYHNNECNTELATNQSKSDIMKRIDLFIINPSYMIDFFTKKVISQWTEPTYESLWLSQLAYYYDQYYDKPSPLLDSVYTGPINKILSFHENNYNTLLYFGAFIGLVMILLDKKRKNEIVLIPLIFLGGFLYHLLFEGKSQYVIIYAIIIIPYAAYGLLAMTNKIEDLISLTREK